MNEGVRAACLTPPAIGGIAVIQVVGRDAIPLLNGHLLSSGSPVDLSKVTSSQLKLCRVVDGSETIDDAVVCTRRGPFGEPVIDLSLHGGIRIVQRLLLMLQREGAQIVQPARLTAFACPARTPLHAQAMELIPGAHTREVVIWLARLPDLLTTRLERILAHLDSGDSAAPAEELRQLLREAATARFLLHGVRAVLVGRSNSGKSTLANVLAGREQAVVSLIAGTTRDWTEHPAVIEGVPFTFVDTAGIRRTADPIEVEAIRRARRQMAGADILIRVIDRSEPPEAGEDSLTPLLDTAGGRRKPLLNVFNKADLPAHPGHAAPCAPENGEPICLSAKTGSGMSRLRMRLLELVGLPARLDWPVAPFTASQARVCRETLAALRKEKDDRTLAAGCLKKLVSMPSSDGRASDLQV